MCEDRQMGCFSLCKAKLFCKHRRRAYCCLQLSNSKIHSRLSTLSSEVPSDSCSHGKLQLDQLHIMSFMWGRFGFLVVGMLILFFPYQVSGQILEEVFRRSCEISFFGDFQSSVGDGPEQPAQTVPALSVCVWQRGFGLNDLQSFLGI